MCGYGFDYVDVIVDYVDLSSMRLFMFVFVDAPGFETPEPGNFAKFDYFENNQHQIKNKSTNKSSTPYQIQEKSKINQNKIKITYK